MSYYTHIDFSPDEILIYLRKSRSDDPMMTVEEVLAKHETILNEWAERHLSGPIPQKNIFREVVSGETIDDRPQMLQVLRHMESPRIRAILCVEVQRLSRGDLEDAGRLIKLLRYTNTMVITPHMIYDLQNEYDRDAFERELKRGNEFLEYQKKIMKRGRELAVSQGCFIGSVPPYGFDKTTIMNGKRKLHTLKENKDQADVVRMIFDMYVNQDLGYSKICRALDSLGIKSATGRNWSPATLKDLLSNEHYIGMVKWDYRKGVNIVEDGEIIKIHPKQKKGAYKLYPGLHDRIIDDTLFYAAEKKQGRNHRAKADAEIRNPFASLVYCQCGKAMIYRTNTKDGQTKNEPRLACSDQVHCGCGSCVYDDFVSLAIDALERSIADMEILIKGNGDAYYLHTQQIRRLEKKLTDLQAQELAQWEAQAHPDPTQRMPADIFKLLNAKILREKTETAAALEQARTSLPPSPSQYQDKIARLRDALDALSDPTADAAKKNHLLKSCIDRITYHRDKPERICHEGKQRRKVKGRSVTIDPHPVGGRWTEPPIELDIKLNI